MDIININALSVSTKIGIYAWEQQINQQLLIDISLHTDLSACEDKIEKTVDYAALCEMVTQFVESISFQQHFITAYAKVNKLCTMPVHKQGNGKNYSPFFFNEPVILYQAQGVQSREGSREASFFQI